MIYVHRNDKDSYTIEITDACGTTMIERRRFENETLQEFEERVKLTVDFYIQKTNN